LALGGGGEGEPGLLAVGGDLAAAGGGDGGDDGQAAAAFVIGPGLAGNGWPGRGVGDPAPDPPGLAWRPVLVDGQADRVALDVLHDVGDKLGSQQLAVGRQRLQAPVGEGLADDGARSGRLLGTDPRSISTTGRRNQYGGTAPQFIAVQGGSERKVERALKIANLLSARTDLGGSYPARRNLVES
jgi:hypothetical protein